MRCFWFSSNWILNYYFWCAKSVWFPTPPFLRGFFCQSDFFFSVGLQKHVCWNYMANWIGLKAHIWLFKLILYFLPEIHRHLGVGVVFVQMLLARRQDVKYNLRFCESKSQNICQHNSFWTPKFICPRTSHRFWYPFQCLNNNEISSLPLGKRGILASPAAFSPARGRPPGGNPMKKHRTLRVFWFEKSSTRKKRRKQCWNEGLLLSSLKKKKRPAEIHQILSI